MFLSLLALPGGSGLVLTSKQEDLLHIDHAVRVNINFVTRMERLSGLEEISVKSCYVKHL